MGRLFFFVGAAKTVAARLPQTPRLGLWQRRVSASGPIMADAASCTGITDLTSCADVSIELRVGPAVQKRPGKPDPRSVLKEACPGYIVLYG